MLIIVFAWLGGHRSAKAESIYVAYDHDGVPHFSDQPYSDNYRLYLRDSSQKARVQTEPRAAVGRNQYALTAVIRGAAQEHGLDPALVSAVVSVESAYNPKAISPKGAMGAMQLIPATAKQYGVLNPYDPQQNVAGGARYLRDLLTLYDGNLPLALAAYNAGRGNVAKHSQRIPPFSETMLYVPKVLAKMKEYRQQDGSQP